MNFFRRWVLTVAILVAVTGCASGTAGPPTLQTGPDAEVTIDGLVRVDNAVVPVAYRKPDLDLTPYKRFMLDPVEIAFQKDPGGRRQSSLAGGPGNGHRILLDSNYDWGQNDRFLERHVARTGRAYQNDPDPFTPGSGPILVNANALYGLLNGGPAAYEWLRDVEPVDRDREPVPITDEFDVDSRIEVVDRRVVHQLEFVLS